MFSKSKLSFEIRPFSITFAAKYSCICRHVLYPFLTAWSEDLIWVSTGLLKNGESVESKMNEMESPQSLKSVSSNMQKPGRKPSLASQNSSEVPQKSPCVELFEAGSAMTMSSIDGSSQA